MCIYMHANIHTYVRKCKYTYIYIYDTCMHTYIDYTAVWQHFDTLSTPSLHIGVHRRGIGKRARDRGIHTLIWDAAMYTSDRTGESIWQPMPPKMRPDVVLSKRRHSGNITRPCLWWHNPWLVNSHGNTSLIGELQWHDDRNERRCLHWIQTLWLYLKLSLSRKNVSKMSLSRQVCIHT